MTYEEYGEVFGDIYELLLATIHLDDSERFKKYITKCDINGKNSFGWTPLHMTARYGRVNLCKILLDAGAAIDATDANGWTPLMEAIMQGHTEVAKLLLERGADPHIQSAMGDSAVTLAHKCHQTELLEQM